MTFASLLAQNEIDVPAPFPPDHHLPWWFSLLELGSPLYIGLLIWMLIYCVRRDPQSGTWLWVMLFFQPFGALIYFFVRWLPSTNLSRPGWMRRFTSGNERRRLEIAAYQIGNAHQFIELGEHCREMGRIDEAASAFHSALQKDPQNLMGLWGAANVDFAQSHLTEACEKLEKVLAADPQYKFGDPSLLYARCLIGLNRTADARAHLENHTRRWRHPEALYLLATILNNQGETAAARDMLEGLLMDVEAAPRGIARKFFWWKSRAKLLLRRIPR